MKVTREISNSIRSMQIPSRCLSMIQHPFLISHEDFWSNEEPSIHPITILHKMHFSCDIDYKLYTWIQMSIFLHILIDTSDDEKTYILLERSSHNSSTLNNLQLYWPIKLIWISTFPSSTWKYYMLSSTTTSSIAMERERPTSQDTRRRLHDHES